MLCLASAQQKTAGESGYNMGFDTLDSNLNYDVLDGLLMDRRLQPLGNPGSQMTQPPFSKSQHMSSPGHQMTPHRNVFTPVSLPVHSSSPLPHKQPVAYRQIMPPGSSSDASSWYDAM